ncbi:MAG: hypothetical protein GY822_28370 [Deltaproteobacteria bacterium]|nr:hypothetical protein [Deltaproteobacteria bacterium]
MRILPFSSRPHQKSTLNPAEFSRLIDELEGRTSRELAETRARFHRPQAQNDYALLDCAFAA